MPTKERIVSMLKGMEVVSYDYSGAGAHNKSRHRIARAIGPFGCVPVLTHDMSRNNVLGHMKKMARAAREEQEYKFAGFDFAFSFPFGDHQPNAFHDGSADRAAFWHSVHGLVNGATAQDYVNHYPQFFNQNLPHGQGPQYYRHYRQTEQHAQAAGHPASSVYNLVGAGQVGKASLCGIWMLRALQMHCSKKQLPLAIWPFFCLNSEGHLGPFQWPPEEKCLVVIETYPRVQKNQAAHWNFTDPLQDLADHFGGQLPAGGNGQIPANGQFTDDELDALAAWYGLTCANPPTLLGILRQFPPAPIFLEEGIIFGM